MLRVMMYSAHMRTTVNLDDDIIRALEAIRRESGEGTSAALNRLARRGLAATISEDTAGPFRQTTSPMGRPRFSLDNIGDAIELLEGPDHR